LDQPTLETIDENEAIYFFRNENVNRAEFLVGMDAEMEFPFWVIMELPF
jgi:hypothetical protein